MSPSILVNWYARTGADKLTFPIGASVSKVQRLGILPFRFSVQGIYAPVRPDHFGQTWQLQFLVAPVIPKLIKGNLLE